MTDMQKARRRKDIAITGWMAKWYDKNSRTSRLQEMNEYADLVSQYAGEGAKVLEVAPGPGYLAVELARRGYSVTGVEISEDFVAIAKRNAREAGVHVDYMQGNASALPLPDDSFSFIICSAAFKNFSAPLQALQEMHRVLKPNGIALILDMNHEATTEEMDQQIDKYGLKGFDRWFVRLSFTTFLKKGAYTKKDFEAFIRQSNFKRHEIHKYGMGFQVWLFKQDTT